MRDVLKYNKGKIIREEIEKIETLYFNFQSTVFSSKSQDSTLTS